jgi:type III pantothenate kinase
MEQALGRIISCRIFTVGPGLKTGLKIQMDNPAQVGADLIVGAVAGIHDYPCPLIIIDMGTATTICVIGEDKTYLGGMILPGLRVSLDSLTSRTSQLPRISLDPPKRLIGKNTIECMKSGILHGNASMLDGMIERIEDDLGMKTTVIATGGLAGTITPLCRHEINLDDDLLLRGLNYIYRKNT